MHTHPNERVGSVGERVAEHLDEIAAYFKPGAVITVVVRFEGIDDHTRDLIMTSDKIPKVIKALQHHMTATDSVRAEVQAD